MKIYGIILAFCLLQGCDNKKSIEHFNCEWLVYDQFKCDEIDQLLYKCQNIDVTYHEKNLDLTSLYFQKELPLHDKQGLQSKPQLFRFQKKRELDGFVIKEYLNRTNSYFLEITLNNQRMIISGRDASLDTGIKILEQCKQKGQIKVPLIWKRVVHQKP